MAALPYVLQADDRKTTKRLHEGERSDVMLEVLDGVKQGLTYTYMCMCMCMLHVHVHV